MDGLNRLSSDLAAFLRRVSWHTWCIYSMSPLTAAQTLRCKKGLEGWGCGGRTENVKLAGLS